MAAMEMGIYPFSHDSQPLMDHAPDLEVCALVFTVAATIQSRIKARFHDVYEMLGLFSRREVVIASSVL